MARNHNSDDYMMIHVTSNTKSCFLSDHAAYGNAEHVIMSCQYNYEQLWTAWFPEVWTFESGGMQSDLQRCDNQEYV